MLPLSELKEEAAHHILQHWRQERRVQEKGIGPIEKKNLKDPAQSLYSVLSDNSDSFIY